MPFILKVSLTGAVCGLANSRESPALADRCILKVVKIFGCLYQQRLMVAQRALSIDGNRIGFKTRVADICRPIALGIMALPDGRQATGWRRRPK